MSVPKKEVDFLAHHPPRAQALAVALRLAGGSREGDPTPQGAGAIPLCPRASLPPNFFRSLVCGSIRCVEFLRFIDLGFAMGQVE